MLLSSPDGDSELLVTTIWVCSLEEQVILTAHVLFALDVQIEMLFMAKNLVFICFTFCMGQGSCITSLLLRLRLKRIA